jgi:hypothetical protein
MSDESHPIPEAKCPHCGHEVDRTFEAHGDAKPSPGDTSLCIRCGGVSVFTSELGQRLPSETERLEIENDPEVIRAQIMIRGLKYGP